MTQGDSRSLPCIHPSHSPTSNDRVGYNIISGDNRDPPSLPRHVPSKPSNYESYAFISVPPSSLTPLSGAMLIAEEVTIKLGDGLDLLPPPTSVYSSLSPVDIN